MEPNRRSILVAASLAAGSTLASPAIKQQGRLGIRLLGRWRSDKERTASLWRWPATVTDKESAASVFGRMTWHITSEIWGAEIDGQLIQARYSVVAEDDESVAVLHYTDSDSTPKLTQYFFEGRYVYCLTGHNLEFFVRVEA